VPTKSTKVTRYVCADCLIDPFLKSVAVREASSRVCSYCRKSAEAVIAVALDTIQPIIERGITRDWHDAERALRPVLDEEDGHTVTVVATDEESVPNDDYDPYEVFWEIREFMEREVATDELVSRYADEISDDVAFVRDIRSSIKPSKWSHTGGRNMDTHTALVYTWKWFKEITKHQRRYFFEDACEFWDRLGSGDIFTGSHLDFIRQLAQKAGLYETYGPGQLFYRARVHAPDIDVGSAKRLGPPPKNRARFSNRMSPAGISMFYGALDRETAIEEVVDPTRPGEGKHITSGAFHSPGHLTLLDLRGTSELPSRFDPDAGYLRAPLLFLRDFAEDLAKPVQKDGREHIEYVPTQVLTEYFQRRADGILYRSARKEGGTCCVVFMPLFFGNCRDLGDEDTDTVLVLDRDSVVTQPLR